MGIFIFKQNTLCGIYPFIVSNDKEKNEGYCLLTSALADPVLQAELHHAPVVNVHPVAPRFHCHNKQTDRGKLAVNRRAGEIISASFPSMATLNTFTPCQKIIALVSDVML